MKLAAALLFCVAAVEVLADTPLVLNLDKTIRLPGVKGRFDHFSIDAKGKRLFVAALGNNTLEVIDVAAGKVIKSVRGLHKPTGVLYLPERNQIIVANGDDGTCKIFDGASYDLVRSIDSLDDADNVRFDVKTKAVYVGYGKGGLAVIDPSTTKQTGTIKLAAHPESFQLEQNGKRAFVNVPDAQHIAVVDREKNAMIAKWPMTEFKANFPMALDEAKGRLFVGCRQPPQLLVLDTTAGKRVANLGISDDSDDLFFDAMRQRLYISCGKGFIDVLAATEGDRYERIIRLPTRAGARTSFYSPDLDRFFLAVPERDAQPAEIRIYQPK
jgi:YVTN family beta-propeller protein